MQYIYDNLSHKLFCETDSSKIYVDKEQKKAQGNEWIFKTTRKSYNLKKCVLIHNKWTS